MLSKIDIENELGKGICIVPFREDNLKENSINLSVSEYAWCMIDYKFTKDYKDDCGNQIELVKGEKCVFDINGKKRIVIPPYATVLVETEEVLGIDNRIGGTYHSKVGIASLGIGHIGTMLGPRFCGHSLVALHNISNEEIELKVGETFVSVVFNYLTTKINENNQTDNGHIDKIGELGIKITREEREAICEDWKSDLSKVSEKMNDDSSFKDFKKKLNRRKFSRYLGIFNKKNLIVTIILIIAMYLLFIAAKSLDRSMSNPVWQDRYWTILSTVIIVPFLSMLLRKGYSK